MVSSIQHAIIAFGMCHVVCKGMPQDHVVCFYNHVVCVFENMECFFEATENFNLVHLKVRNA